MAQIKPSPSVLGCRASLLAAGCSRRDFIRWSGTLAAALPFGLSPMAARAADSVTKTADTTPVAIVGCQGYGPEVRTALKQSFDLLGGIGSLVKAKTVTVKLNLTGTDFTPVFKRPVGESYMTHFSTALALTGLLLEAGARRVRLVESTQSKAPLETTLELGDWDVNRLRALGRVEFENTRNLGLGKSYAEFKVPGGGRMFSSFQLNHAYDETDVLVSLCKLKQHYTAGVTLTMKNLFGITPNSLYGSGAGSEDATEGRDFLHSPIGLPRRIDPPGFKFKPGKEPLNPGERIPRIITDLCAARPIHLAIIDGITSMSGAEGPWSSEIKFTKPGVLITGFNPVATDAVGTAVMGFANPRAPLGVEPFGNCENHLLLAEQAGLGTADLAMIDVRGLMIAKVRYPYPPLNLHL